MTITCKTAELLTLFHLPTQRGCTMVSFLITLHFQAGSGLGLRTTPSSPAFLLRSGGATLSSHFLGAHYTLALGEQKMRGFLHPMPKTESPKALKPLTIFIPINAAVFILFMSIFTGGIKRPVYTSKSNAH